MAWSSLFVTAESSDISRPGHDQTKNVSRRGSRYTKNEKPCKKEENNPRIWVISSQNIEDLV